MKTAIKAAAFFTGVALLTVSARSDAGYTDLTTETCSFTGSSGYCYGEVVAFRNAISGDYATFQMYEPGITYFFTSFHNTSAMCQFPAAWSQTVTNAAMANPGYFYVSWDSTGNCTHVTLAHGSPYTQNVY